MFGTLHIYNKKDLSSCKELLKIGPDAISDKFTSDYLFTKLSKANKFIKTFIMDQMVVAGIGNIYADEILFASGILPVRKTGLIELKECQKIVDNAKRILNAAILAGGTTFATFASSATKIGSFQNQLLVYDRGNEPCVKCGTKIIKTKVNGRGTCYCPHCQK
jgi:formamidopyrimidine-DNA glycosylase